MQNIPLKGKEYSIVGRYVIVLPEREVYTTNGNALGKIDAKVDINDGMSAEKNIEEALQGKKAKKSE